MYCKTCKKRGQCKEICSELQTHLKNDVEVKRREVLECELKKINFEEVKTEEEWPEGEIELNIEDWKFFVKKYKTTKKQKRYIFLRYWKHLSFRLIGKKYNVSWQTVDQTIRRFKEKNRMSKVQTVEEYLKEGGKITQCPPDTNTKKEDMNESNLIVRQCDTLYQNIKANNKRKFHKDEHGGYTTKKGKYRVLKSEAPFDITKQWIMEKLLKGTCERTGIKFKYTKRKNDGFTNPFVPSIDRIDNSKEYSKSNCQMVVWMYNRAKGDNTDEDVLYLAESLIKHNKKLKKT